MRNIPKGVLLLTLMIFAGFANAKVDPELLEWATQGDANSQYNLALMCGNGRGFPEDDLLAYMRINLASANGHDVSDAKEILAREMSQADISKAQELTRQYIKDNPGVI